MKTLDEIINSLVPVRTVTGNSFYCEALYSFESLVQEINSSPNEFIMVSECFLTPNYFYGGKRYELYEYELSITFGNESFEKYLRRKTGRFDISTISQDIVALHRECHIQLSQSVSIISKSRFNQYVQFLYNNINLIRRVKKIFTKFDPKFLTFEYYSFPE